MSCYDGPYSTVEYTGDGDTTTYAIPFPYIAKANVSATVNGVDTEFSWVTDSTIQFTTAPADASQIIITRCTEPLNPLVDFSDGSTLREADLDLETDQLLYLIQELADEMHTIDQEGAGTLDIKAKVSSTDTTTDYLLNKITSTGGTIAITRTSPGGDEKLNLEAIPPEPETLSLRIWLDVTQAVTKTYITTDDWRGRSISFRANFYDHASGASEAQANADVWKQYITAINNGFGIFRIGKNYSGIDVELGHVTVNTGGDGGNLILGIDGANGKLYVDSSSGGFGSRFHCELVIEGQVQTDAADLVI